MELASVPKVLTAARTSKTNRSAYSVRSWPLSSFHSRASTYLITYPRANFETIKSLRTLSRGRRSGTAELSQVSYVLAVLRFVAALVKTDLMAVASVLSVAVAAKANKTRSNAYSVKSWPSSSFQSLTKRSFMEFLSVSSLIPGLAILPDPKLTPGADYRPHAYPASVSPLSALRPAGGY
jgi:hypothetical protein